MSVVQKRARSRISPDLELPIERQPLLPSISVLVSSFPHVRYMHILVSTALCIAGLVYICTTLPPSRVADILFFQSYLPFLVLCAAATFFFFSFLLLNSRRAALIAAAGTVLLFFKLQDFLVTTSLVLFLFAPLLLIELSSHLVNKK